MENNILKDELAKIGFEAKRNQDKFFFAIYDFLHSDKKFLVARGGMGLGKTMATAVNIKSTKNIFSKFFVATPFAKVKDSWADDFNTLSMRYAIWLSKLNCCKQYHSDISDCNDECPHRAHLEKNNTYSIECDQVCEHLLDNSPITTADYYDKFGDDDCLWPVVKNGLQREKINIGDYFPTFKISMLNNMIFKNGSSRQNGVVIYDEAHRLPNRLRDFFSKRFHIEKRILGLENEAKNFQGGPKYIELCYYIQIIKKWYKGIKKIIANSENGQEFYSYDDFLSYFKPNEYSNFIQLLDYLTLLTVKDKESFKDDEEMKNCERWINFLEYWQSVSSNKTYQGYIQLIRKYDEEDIILDIRCEIISDKAPRILDGWNKVIFMSGTIDETFLEGLGLDVKDVMFTEKIDSFTIKEDCVIYAKGKFTSQYRHKSIEEYENEILEMVNTMDGRIIIFVPAMSFGNEIEKIILKTNRPVFSACNRNQNQKSKIIEDFVDSKDGVLVFGMRQGIDGENLVSEEEIIEVSSKVAKKYAIENAIVIGYPYRVRDKIYDKQIQIHEDNIKKKYPYLAGTKTMAKRIVEYFPVSRDIHQAVTRLKRNDHDVPCIILFGEEFGRKEERACLDNDLSSNIEYIFPNILEFIKKQNNKRKEVRNGKTKN